MDSDVQIIEGEAETLPLNLIPTPTTVEVNSASAVSGSKETADSSTRRSSIWRHFKIIQEGQKDFAKFKYCPYGKYSISKKCNASTGNLIKHIQNRHSDKLVFDDANISSPASQTNNPIKSLISRKQNTGAKLTQEEFRKKILTWIVKGNQPFTEVESKQFQDLMKYLNPSVKDEFITANTLKSDIMKEYATKKLELLEQIKAIGSKLSFTHDIWTSRNQHCFLGIKVHWISDDWTPTETVLGFPAISGSHTGLNIRNSFCNVLTTNNIDKIMAITTDSASNTFFQELYKASDRTRKIRIRCTAHILHLAVQDLLNRLMIAPTKLSSNEEADNSDSEGEDSDEEIQNQTEIQPSDDMKCIRKLRQLVRKFRKSPQLIEKLNSACKHHKVEPNRLIIDVKTRWNSTYAMIQRALELKIPIYTAIVGNSALSSCFPTDVEWTLLEKTMNLLQFFDRATHHISMARRQTASAVVPMFDWIQGKLAVYIRNNTGVLKVAATKAQDKLLKYQPKVETDPLLFVATVLDPTLKLNYFKINRDLWKADEVTKIKDLFISEYNRYEATQENISTPTAQHDSMFENEGDQDDFLYHLSKRSKTSKSSENEAIRYLALPQSGSEALSWWKSNGKDFPNLSRMAKDVFSIQSTSVSTERLFSVGTSLVVPNRGSLSASTISAVMCLNSWL